MNLHWHLWVTRLNDMAPATVTSSVKSDGTPLLRQYNLITKSVKDTGTWLLRAARDATRRVLSTPFLINTLVTDTGLQVAPVLTNNCKLAEQLGCSEKTVQNHIGKLTKYGLIARKVWHGSNACYELWINPDFVWEKLPTPVENPVGADSEKTQIGAIIESIGLKLPHTEVLETTGNLKVKVGDGGKLSNARLETPFAGNEGQQSPVADDAQTSKKEGRGGAARKSTATTPEAEALAQQVKVAQNKAYCVSAWEYAKALIYQGPRWQTKVWSAEEERNALIAIWEGVYLGFRDPACNYAAYHEQVLRRIELVRIYCRDHAGAYASLPYAEMLPGRGYFDAENAKGFAGTRSWFVNDTRRRRKNALEVALVKAVVEMKQRRNYDRLGSQAKTNRRIRSHSLLQLHSEHCGIIRRLGGEDGLYRFAQKLQHLRIVAGSTQNPSTS